MKKFLFLFVIVLSLSAVCAWADDEIKININNTAIESDVPPQIIDGRTMVPVRAIFEGVGANVEWNAEDRKITGILGPVNVVMTIDSTTAYVNGSPVEMDCLPVIIDGITLAPARYVAESFGCQVEWNGESREVNISTPVVQLGETATQTEITTEKATETTTAAETTTHPMNNYDTFYKPGTYHVGKDMPSGEYVVFANPDKIGYLYKYSKDGQTSTTSGKKYIYSKHFSYCDVINLSDNNYLDLSNAYAVPSNDVKKLDISHNGTYRAGKDISTGHLTFKLSPKAAIAYIDIGYSEDAEAQRTITYLTKDDNSIVVKVSSGMRVRIFGCDILNERLSTIASYEPPVENGNNTDNSQKFSDISASFKQEIDQYMLSFASDISALSLNSTKFTSAYQKQMYNSWMSKASNSAERKYAGIANDIYTNIRDCAVNTKGELIKANTISTHGRQISSTEFINRFNAQKDYITAAVNYFVKGTSFEDIEVATYRMSQYRYDVPRLNGSAVN